jgi:hypothetical protein
MTDAVEKVEIRAVPKISLGVFDELCWSVSQPGI